MKKVPYTEMSNRRCEICGKPIKKNVADRKPTQKHLFCFHHWRDITEHYMATAREVRRDPSKRSKSRLHVPLRSPYV